MSHLLLYKSIMQALDSLPDGDGEYLPLGNCVPNLWALKIFLSDLHETIVAHVLDGRTRFCEIIDGKRMIFQLPQKEQLYDFIAVSREEGKAYEIVLMIPGTQASPDEAPTYHKELFEYKPPEPPDTSYLHAFSQN